MTGYFIENPIVGWVIAIILMLAGVLALHSLPIAQFPAIAPPAVTITATYPGADAQTLRVLVVVYCVREAGSVIRLISTRKATRSERVQYDARRRR